ncbi:hypothetical protein Slin15195_G066180 [Septoria linicola]|uniref:Rhodopsin domain-containing protein n=1 Tax=Septoria linicola TaxID=215465 RepID=A0A9Q9APY0_9PEZI|nr:hypothetical protein Slin15195_G066180 [Septoria linicola]
MSVSPSVKANASPGEVAQGSSGFVEHGQVITLYAINGVFLSLAVFAVTCRAIALYLKRSAGGWDDWTTFFCLAPTVALAALTSVQARGIYTGPGTGQTPFAWLQRILIETWVIQILTITSLYVFKLSICIRYLRIADNLYSCFWRFTMAMIALLTAHYISSFVVWGVQCVPAQRYWDPTVPGRCIRQSSWILSVNGVNLATDVMVLILPIYPVAKLRLPPKQRLAILAIFTVGGLSTIAGCLRFYHLYRFDRMIGNLGANTLDIEIWCFIEITLGMFCACMPAFRNLYTFLRYGRQKAWSAEKSAPTEPKASESTSRSRFNFLSKKKFLRSIQASGFDANDDIERVYQQNRDGSVPNSNQSVSRKASTTPTESQSISHGRKRPYETL